MRRWLLVLALASIPAPTLAQGIDISWDECVGTGLEAVNKNFVCTGTVNQMYRLVFQFKTPVDIPNFVGITAQLDFESSTLAPLSPFWHHETGGCPTLNFIRGVAIFDNKQLLPGCAESFLDPWDEDGSPSVEAIVLYQPDYPANGQGRFQLVVARGDAVPIVAGANYYAFHLAFNNRFRNTCPGCSDAGTLTWTRAFLESNDGSPPLELYTADKYGSCVGVNIASGFPCPDLPARPQTWAGIKALYR